jgi:broad specificity phosphatase PhoE
MKKTLVIIRHAHRNLDDRTRDNGLSDRGEEQVKKLVKFYKTRFDGEKASFYCSPKKRCVETLSPLAVEGKSKAIEIDDRLDEHQASENMAMYLARMDEFLDVWKYEGAELTVICSHGDWIPIAVKKLVGVQIDIKKSGWIEIEYQEGADASLTWLVQKLY